MVMGLRGSRLYIPLLAILVILGTALVIPPTYSQERVVQSIDAVVESTGGNLYIKIKVEGDALKTVNRVEAYIPEDYLGEKGSIRTYTDEGTDRVEIPYQYSDGVLSVSQTDINEILFIDIYIPEAIVPVERGRYTIDVLTYVEMNIPIAQVEFEFRPALDVKGVDDELPVGFTQVRSSPEGITPEQYEISRILVETEILLLEGTEITTFPLEQSAPNRLSLILADTYAVAVLDADTSGVIRGVLNISITNRDFINWPDGTEIFFNKTYKIKNVKTELGKPVDFEFTGRVYKIQLPYILKPNETIFFVIDFVLEDNVTLIPGITPIVEYDVLLPPPTTIPLDSYRILFPEIGFEQELTYYTDFDEPLRLSGQVQITLIDVLEDYGIVYILSSIVLVGIAAAVYSKARKIVLKDLPDKVLKFINEYEKKIEVMREILELEKKYSEGGISSREYSRKRNQLERKIREVERKLAPLKKEVEELAEENEEVSLILSDMDELDDIWKRLKELDEKKRKRIISPEEYKEDREELLTRFEIVINKILKRKL